METIRLVYPVEGGDLIEAGEASSKMKLTLKKLGLPQDVIRRASRWRWTPIRLLSA